VRVDLVALPGVEGEDNLGLAPTDYLGQLAPEWNADLKLAVLVAQERHLLDAQDLRRGELLGLTCGDKPLGRGSRAVAALISGGREHILRAVAGLREAGESAGAEELGIVGMREDRHHTRSGMGLRWLGHALVHPPAFVRSSTRCRSTLAA